MMLLTTTTTTMLTLWSLLGAVRAQPHAGSWDVGACTFAAASGKMFDLSALRVKNGSFLWQQTLWNVADSAPNDLTGSEPAQLTAFFELQICANVKSSFPSACRVPSPVNMIDSTKKTCTPLGDLRTTSMDVVPSGNGILIRYYHGAYVNDIVASSASIYLECGV